MTLVIAIIELLVPIGILGYTHYLDERIHSHLEHNNVYHSRAKWIFRYQWEICLLVISLLLISGVKMLENDFNLTSGIVICVEAGLLLIYLAILTIQVLTSKRVIKPTAKPIYLAIVVYLQLGVQLVFLAFTASEVKNHFQDNTNYVISISLSVVIGLLICLILRWWLYKVLFQPVVLKSTPLKELMTISKHDRAGEAMKIEALKKIIHDAKPGSKYWKYAKQRLERDYPKHRII